MTKDTVKVKTRDEIRVVPANTVCVERREVTPKSDWSIVESPILEQEQADNYNKIPIALITMDDEVYIQDETTETWHLSKILPGDY